MQKERNRAMLKFVLVLGVCAAFSIPRPAAAESGFLPGMRVLPEAHNCYPYGNRYADRIDRALAAGLPLGIENDYGWYTDPTTGHSRIIVVHEKPYKGTEPGPREYFFEKVRPIVEKALKDGNPGDWPLITLNINDLRGSEPAFFKAVWDLLGEYEPWLCTSVKQPAPDPPVPLDVKPLLVLCGGGNNETRFFYDEVPVGAKLRVFGHADAQPAGNFRRWLNHSWRDVEPEGQPKAGEWTPEKAARLQALVDDAHQRGYWIRFYALNGHPAAKSLTDGLSPAYNFGSIEAVQIRWQAALEAGVDFIATDQCAELSAFLDTKRKP